MCDENDPSTDAHPLALFRGPKHNILGKETRQACLEVASDVTTSINKIIGQLGSVHKLDETTC